MGKKIDLIYSGKDEQKATRILTQLKRGKNLTSQEVSITHMDGSVTDGFTGFNIITMSSKSCA